MALVKGPTTAVAHPDGRVRLALAGTTALATAGTGDVLSGVIAALLAQGCRAAGGGHGPVAAHVHGRAGALGPGDGLVAGDLPDLVARVLAALGRPEGGGGSTVAVGVREGSRG